METKHTIGERFEKEFGTQSDYFNHRVGLFMDMKDWIVKEVESERAQLADEISLLKAENERLFKLYHDSEIKVDLLQDEIKRLTEVIKTK